MFDSVLFFGFFYKQMCNMLGLLICEEKRASSSALSLCRIAGSGTSTILKLKLYVVFNSLCRYLACIMF